jgi:predicted O-methyltransferase YrrM
MDTTAFRAALDRFVRSDEGSWDPDGTLERLLAEVPGLSSRGKLGLLRLAAAHLAPGEAYVEVGSWKGLSIIAAMLGNAEAPFYAIESFDGYGVRGREARKALRRNVEAWVGEGRLRLLEGDFVDLLGRGPIPEPIGVYFYDADHSSLGQYLALGVAEPHLADEALVVIDDTASRVVARATDRYVREHPGYELLADLPGSPSGGRWWNGLRIYAFRRAQAAAAAAAGVVWRRAVYRAAYRPAAFLVGRVMPRAGLRLAHAVRSLPRLLRGHPREPIGSFALLEASPPTGPEGNGDERKAEGPGEAGSGPGGVGRDAYTRPR